MRAAAIKEGLPAEAVACMTEATIEGTESLMKHKQTALILATGGIGLVRAAYSSGKPAFGVGPGNVPVFIERTAETGLAVQNILTGKCFDNGTICASEQAVVVDAPIAREIRAQFEAQGGHFLSAVEADQLAKVVVTSSRTLNPKIVGKSVKIIAELAGLNVPEGTRCLMAEVGGVGREHPLSMEKLSPILAFYVVDGLDEGAARCFEILSYGGMGHTAGIHTRSRDAARTFGTEMPASRVIVNSPTTHGAIGFSTALPPSMTLGCGSWGGNVTSDNISPLHLMDIKRVAFETKPVKSLRPATSAQSSTIAASTTPNINREDIARIVDRFMTNRGIIGNKGDGNGGNEGRTNGGNNVALPATASPAPAQPLIDIGANLTNIAPAAPHAEAAPTADVTTNGNAPSQPAPQTSPAPAPPSSHAPQSSTNGKVKSAVDFVCEEDVRRALQNGEKIYTNARTIITPAARDMGDAAEVFAKG